MTGHQVSCLYFQHDYSASAVFTTLIAAGSRTCSYNVFRLIFKNTLLSVYTYKYAVVFMDSRMQISSVGVDSLHC